MKRIAIIAVVYLMWLIIGLSYQLVLYSEDYDCDDMAIDAHDRLTGYGIESHYAGYVGYEEKPGHVWVVIDVAGAEIPFETTNGVGIPTHPWQKYVSPDVVFATTEEMVAFDRW